MTDDGSLVVVMMFVGLSSERVASGGFARSQGSRLMIMQPRRRKAGWMMMSYYGVELMETTGAALKRSPSR